MLRHLHSSRTRLVYTVHWAISLFVKVLGLAYKLGHQKFSLGLVSFGSGDETSLGQHSMYLPSFYLTSPHFKTLPCRSVFAINYAIKY